jgi:DHA1 family multidrug resistance protein-like MFS transporter
MVAPMNEPPPPAASDPDHWEPPRWRVTLWSMVAVQFIMSISFGIVGPIMPLYLPELGVVSPAAVNMWAGVLTSATSCVAIFTSPLWGGLADRYGRKLMVLRSTLGIAVFTFLMGIAQGPWQMLGLRAGMGALAGFSSASVVMVASSVPERRMGYSLGWMSTGQLVGSLVGPLIGGGIADLTGSYRLPFFFGGVICFCGFLVTLFFVPEKFTPPDASKAKPSLVSGFRMVIASGGLMAVIMVMMMGQFATQAVLPVVTLYVREILGARPDIATLGGLAFSATGLAGVMAVPFLGRRSDRIGYRRTLLICLFGAALFTLPMAAPFGYWAFVAERFGLGLFIGAVLPVSNAMVGRLTDPAQRGMAYGVISSAYFIGNTTGPLAGGAIAATVGINWVFAVTGALLAVNFVWVWFKVPDVGQEEG